MSTMGPRLVIAKQRGGARAWASTTDQSQVGDGFDVAIDGTRGGAKRLLVGFEDGGEF